MTKVVIFDQDETLIQPDTGLYTEYVLERAKDFATVKGISDIEQAKREAYDYKIRECNSSTITLYDNLGLGRKIWYDKMNKIDVSKYLREEKDLNQFLSELRARGLKLVLMTNSPTIQTKKIFDAVKVGLDLFDLIFTWEGPEMEPPKPSTIPFETIFSKFAVEPHECVMVGNEIEVDLKVAHELGVTTVGINLETKKNELVDYEIIKLKDISNLINKI